MRDPESYAAWRAWSEEAAPELLERFDRQSLEVLRSVRHRFPHDCGPQHPAYQELRWQSIEALDALCQEIGTDAFYQDS